MFLLNECSQGTLTGISWPSWLSSPWHFRQIFPTFFECITLYYVTNFRSQISHLATFVWSYWYTVHVNRKHSQPFPQLPFIKNTGVRISGQYNPCFRMWHVEQWLEKLKKRNSLTNPPQFKTLSHFLQFQSNIQTYSFQNFRRGKHLSNHCLSHFPRKRSRGLQIKLWNHNLSLVLQVLVA